MVLTQYWLHTNHTDRDNLRLTLWMSVPLHYLPNYPSTWDISCQITFLLNKSLR